MVRVLILLALLLPPGLAWAESLPSVQDLAADAATMRREKAVLLLVFTEEYCLYCHRLKQGYLLPMERNGDHADRLLIREVPRDHPTQSLQDFDGSAQNVRTLTERYNISLVPTMLFLGPNGEELVDRFVGLGPEDFFGYYLNEAIDRAHQRLIANEG